MNTDLTEPQCRELADICRATSFAGYRIDLGELLRVYNGNIARALIRAGALAPEDPSDNRGMYVVAEWAQRGAA